MLRHERRFVRLLLHSVGERLYARGGFSVEIGVDRVRVLDADAFVELDATLEYGRLLAWSTSFNVNERQLHRWLTQLLRDNMKHAASCPVCEPALRGQTFCAPATPGQVRACARPDRRRSLSLAPAVDRVRRTRSNGHRTNDETKGDRNVQSKGKSPW